jgi:hypothetical protein
MRPAPKHSLRELIAALALRTPFQSVRPALLTCTVCGWPKRNPMHDGIGRGAHQHAPLWMLKLGMIAKPGAWWERGT